MVSHSPQVSEVDLYPRAAIKFCFGRCFGERTGEEGNQRILISAQFLHWVAVEDDLLETATQQAAFWPV